MEWPNLFHMCKPVIFLYKAGGSRHVRTDCFFSKSCLCSNFYSKCPNPLISPQYLSHGALQSPLRRPSSAPRAINFNHYSPKSKECFPKKGFGTDLGKNNYGIFLSNFILNLFLIRHLELGICAFGQKLNYGRHPLLKTIRLSDFQSRILQSVHHLKESDFTFLVQVGVHPGLRDYDQSFVPTPESPKSVFNL